MAGYSQCPAGLSVAESKQRCNTGVYIESWNSHHVNEPLRYERNAEGDMSSIRCWDLDNSGRCLQHSGPFVRNGCSLMPKADGSERLQDILNSDFSTLRGIIGLGLLLGSMAGSWCTVLARAANILPGKDVRLKAWTPNFLTLDFSTIISSWLQAISIT